MRRRHNSDQKKASWHIAHTHLARKGDKLASIENKFIQEYSFMSQEMEQSMNELMSLLAQRQQEKESMFAMAIEEDILPVMTEPFIPLDELSIPLTDMSIPSDELPIMHEESLSEEIGHPELMHLNFEELMKDPEIVFPDTTDDQVLEESADSFLYNAEQDLTAVEGLEEAEVKKLEELSQLLTSKQVPPVQVHRIETQSISTPSQPMPTQLVENETPESIHQKLQVLQIQEEIHKNELKILEEQERNATLTIKHQQITSTQSTIQSQIDESRQKIKLQEQEIEKLDILFSSWITQLKNEMLKPLQDQLRIEDEKNKQLFNKSSNLSERYEELKKVISSSDDTIQYQNGSTEDLDADLKDLERQADVQIERAQKSLEEAQQDILSEKRRNELLQSKLASLHERKEMMSKEFTVSDGKLACPELQAKKVEMHDILTSMTQTGNAIDQEMNESIALLQCIDEAIQVEKQKRKGLEAKLDKIVRSKKQLQRELDPVRDELDMYREDVLTLEKQIAKLGADINVYQKSNEQGIVVNARSEKQASVRTKSAQPVQITSTNAQRQIASDTALQTSAIRIQRWWRRKSQRSKIRAQALKEYYDRIDRDKPKLIDFLQTTPKTPAVTKYDSAIKILSRSESVDENEAVSKAHPLPVKKPSIEIVRLPNIHPRQLSPPSPSYAIAPKVKYTWDMLPAVSFISICY